MFIDILETSQFYHDFRKEVQSSRISKRIRMVLGSESKLPMIIYGIGSLLSEYDNSPSLQLGLALLMKKDFVWIGELQVFDPILTSPEIKALESLGCSVLNHDEEGRRQALQPTMFFMPHCDINLFNNLLEANWEPNLLRNVIIFGNSFDWHIDILPDYSRDFSSNNRERKLCIWTTMGHVLAAETFTDEFKLRAISYDLKTRRKGKSKLQREHEDTFHGLSWHFFSPLTETWMGLMRWYIREELAGGKKQNLATSNPSPNC
ncbi:hypothetical protein K1719_038917 [Acacia pycnantha]|nr:hypothetical protein K1719_038917 [Acacia pycnantha]